MKKLLSFAGIAAIVAVLGHWFAVRGKKTGTASFLQA